MRRTKIVATVGPASESDEVIQALVAAGVDVLRLSFAHGDLLSCIDRLRRVRALAPDLAIMVDIPGPKIRAGSFGTSPVTLALGSSLILEEGFGDTSTASRIVVERDDVINKLSVGDYVHIGDGGTSLEVTQAGTVATAVVISGGAVMGKPGLSLPSSLMHDQLPTADDRERIEALRSEKFEILAVSFVRSRADVAAVREALQRDDVMIMSKIETAEAVDALIEIVEESDALMVARGDLGVRMPIEDVPHLQKRIVKEGIRFARPVVVATQMLESMTHAQVPTRAEVTDVANAVLDGASAVMLSAETAIGNDPVAVVTTMDRIILRAEAGFDYQKWGSSLGVQEVSGTRSEAIRITAAMTGAAWRAAMEEEAAAIIACTRSGMTARAISRFRPPMPILAITPSHFTARQLKSSWGVNDVLVSSSTDIDDLVHQGIEHLRADGIVKSGDYVVVMAGSDDGGLSTTDTVRMVAVK
ncbi:MAG: pyruvate kinase [Actinobacteria bacterium]|uniref:pyruvate kinase n=1 Tax=freshwater metagenome TaxID=449393 RepID=A0A6J6W954_9ZZZZ|nr:pyruvate kinase [Actinomycetota bacterium]